MPRFLEAGHSVQVIDKLQFADADTDKRFKLGFPACPASWRRTEIEAFRPGPCRMDRESPLRRMSAELRPTTQTAARARAGRGLGSCIRYLLEGLSPGMIGILGRRIARNA